MSQKTSGKQDTIAVIGLGRMGLRHLQVVNSLDFKIVGVADLNAEACASAAATYGLDATACFTDAFEMLATTKPTAVVIATTAPSHAAFVEAAVANGSRYILCEKPMAVSLDEVSRMQKLCAQNNVVLAVNHQMRFMEQYTKVKALIESGNFGPLTSILVAGSNFGLAMNASHYFEMFRFMTGQDVTSVSAWFDETLLANPRGPQFEDRSGRLLAASKDGVSMYIDFSGQAGWGLQVVYICLHGQIIVDELHGYLRTAVREDEFKPLPTSRYGMPAVVTVEQIEPADAIAPTLAVWRAMLAGGDYPDGAAGAHAMACLVSAHVSHSRGGASVRLDDPEMPRGQVFKWA